jgi:predicted phage terminase large subunit-like protein
MDEAALAEKRRAVGAYFWAAMYQQRPSPEDGQVFLRHGVRYWRYNDDGNFLLRQANGDDKLAKAENCRIFTTVDLATSERTSSDYTVIMTWALTIRNDLVLIDRRRSRLTGPDQVPALRDVYERFNPYFLAIEKAGYQLSVIQNARFAGLPCKECSPKGDKYGRALQAAAMWEAGSIYLPGNAGWVDELVEELISFPNGSHDDQADCVSYAAIEAAKMAGGWDSAYGVETCARCGTQFYAGDDGKRPCVKCGCMERAEVV